MKINEIETWQQGKFIDSWKYSHIPDFDKKVWAKQEKHLVRPSPKGNVICGCNDPEDAVWIAERLNLAAKAEKIARQYSKGRIGWLRVQQEMSEYLQEIEAEAKNDD